MSEVDKFLAEQVNVARSALPFMSSYVKASRPPINDLSLREQNCYTSDCSFGSDVQEELDAEREAIVGAIKENYSQDFEEWFKYESESNDVPEHQKPHLVIVSEFVLPDKGARCLKIAGLAVVIALYEMDSDDYTTLPNALLVSGEEPNFDAFSAVVQAMGKRDHPTDFALM